MELDSQPSTPEKGRGGARKRPTPSKPRQSPAKKAKTTGNARQDAKSAGARGGGRRGKVVNSSREAQAEEEGCSEIELDDQTFQKVSNSLAGSEGGRTAVTLLFCSARACCVR